MNAGNTPLEQRIIRLHASLGVVVSDDFESVLMDVTPQGTSMICFSGTSTQADLANDLSVLIANIASLKDHLKDWCKTKSTVFEGDKLIDSDRDVAIIHDLWNLDKHASLVKSRSGLFPSLTGVFRALRTSDAPGSMITVEHPSGMRFQTSDTSRLITTATVRDKSGVAVGDLLAIADRAVDGWECTLRRAGVRI